jgi:hypothetical protein
MIAAMGIGGLQQRDLGVLNGKKLSKREEEPQVPPLHYVPVGMTILSDRNPGGSVRSAAGLREEPGYPGDW